MTSPLSPDPMTLYVRRRDWDRGSSASAIGITAFDQATSDLAQIPRAARAVRRKRQATSRKLDKLQAIGY